LPEVEVMTKHSVTWIVMADGSRARIVSPRRGESGFDVLSELASQEAHVPSHEIWSGRSGRTQESGNSAHHAIEARQDPHEARKTAFIRSVAERLNRAAIEKAFDRLILFAPPRCLGELREALGEAASGKIKGAAPKDLTKLPLIELPQHLEALTER
jgi:protein required for attachment to host cells